MSCFGASTTVKSSGFAFFKFIISVSFVCHKGKSCCGYQVLACKQALQNGWLESPYMPHQETLEIMKIMDRLRKQWGVVYPMD